MQSFRLPLKLEPQHLPCAVGDLEPVVDPQPAHPDDLAAGGDEHRVPVFFAERDPASTKKSLIFFVPAHAQRDEPVARAARTAGQVRFVPVAIRIHLFLLAGRAGASNSARCRSMVNENRASPTAYCCFRLHRTAEGARASGWPIRQSVVAVPDALPTPCRVIRRADAAVRPVPSNRVHVGRNPAAGRLQASATCMTRC